MGKNIERVHPFDSFIAICKILVWAGFYKLLDEPATRLKRITHQVYRVLGLVFLAVFNVQHLIYTAQHRHDIIKLVDCLVIEITQVNLFIKVLNMLIHTSRIDKLQEVICGPYFAANDELDEVLLIQNKKEMYRLYRLLLVGITITACLWPTSFFVYRYNDETAEVNSYMPFETDTWGKFTLSVLLETGPILWIGYGHMFLDSLIAAYYAHAHTQLKIIKHQLERLCSIKTDDNIIQHDLSDGSARSVRLQYIDVCDRMIYQRFVRIMKRYETLIWYVNEVEEVFNFPLLVQFLSTGLTVCLVIFRMTAMSVTSFPFMFLIMLWFSLLLQVLMYCYYGNLVQFESTQVNDSLYASDWVLLSPSFRRSVLVAMTRWSSPIRPRVYGILPLSLDTFAQIVKSSYTLYTVLMVTAKPETN